ncbi:MAG: DEAD/DEAH box helicase, partial [Candidatus Aenigmatarchaeota archaeon]
MTETELNPFMDGLKSSLENFEENAEKLKEKVEELEEEQIRKIADKVDLDGSDIKKEDFRDFVRKPYLINPKDEETYEVVVPKFLDFQVGRLDRQVSNYNVFVVDKYTKWMTGVPEFLEEEIDINTEQNFKVEDDLLEFNPEKEEVVKENTSINRHVSNVEDGKATVKTGHEFELVAELIERGELPFVPQPVDESDMRKTDMRDPDKPNNEFELKDFQQDGYEKFLENGHACFCWMTGAGKSFPALKALDSLEYDEENMRKAVVVYGKATRDQWENYIETYAPRLKDEVEIVTYHSVDKLSGKGRYVLIVFDECHSLPADTFAKGSTIPTKYRLGLSATPYREDGRTNYIFALTGQPIGLDWQETLDIMEKEYHEVNIHIVKDRQEKIERIKGILEENPEKNTLIFCDGLDFGDEIAEETGLKFVSGRDSDQLEKIRSHDRRIVSRIGDHGISLENLQVALEADFLFGSRRQELQRSGRLFHGEGERHDIFFTAGEFNKHQKRLYSLIEKGFSLNFVDKGEEIEVPDKYKNRVDLDLGGEKVSEEGVRFDATNMGDIEFLKNDTIKEEIESRIEETTGSSEKIWKALIHIAKSDNGLSRDEIAKKLGVST